MKINTKLLAIFGFLIQVLLFIPVAQKFLFTPTNYIIYLILTALFLVYNLFSGFRFSLKNTFYSFLIITYLAFLIAVFAQPGHLTNLLLLFTYGLITSILAGIILYHLKKIFLLAASESNFHFIAEITLTFFASGAYILSFLLNVPPTTTVLLFGIILLVAFLMSIITYLSLNAVLNQFKSKIKEKTEESAFLDGIPVLKQVYQFCSSFFEKTSSSLNEIETLSQDIRNSSEDLSSASEEMNASLEEVSSTIQHIAKGAQDQSEAITAIARSIEELDRLTTSISSQVKMANVSSRRTTESAKKGMEFTVQQAKILKDIFEQTKSIEEKMAKLRDQATEIKKIVDIIQGITEQTDLLALNAAIEAARVGEQGKGFAVVADEIRNLANETQKSSTTVENLISDINKTIQELNNLLNIEREKIDEANISASQTEEEFSGIVKAVNLVTDMITRINEAAGNQLSHTKELVKKVEQVAQVAADTAAASEEVSAAVEEQTASMEQFSSTAQLLSQVVLKLNGIVKEIKR